MSAENKKNDDFDKTRFAAKSGLLGMGADVATDVVTNGSAFYKNNKGKINDIMKGSGKTMKKIKQVASMPESKELAKHLKSQQKGSLGLSAAFAAGTTALALKDDLKKKKERMNNMENTKIANETTEQTQEKVAAEVKNNKMASIPGTPEWIKSRKSSK